MFKPVASALRQPIVASAVNNSKRVALRSFANSTSCGCCGTLPFLCTNRVPRTANNKHNFQSRKSLTTDSTLTDDNIDHANPHIRDLLRNNRKWVAEKNQEDPTFFKNLAQGQKPKYLYFGCSDSRVPANEILGLGYVHFCLSLLQRIWLTNPCRCCFYK